MASNRPQNIPDIEVGKTPIQVSSAMWNEPDEKGIWDQFDEGVEEIEEEDLGPQQSYEVFEPPPPEEREIGQIIRDTFGFYKRMDTADEMDPKAKAKEEVIYRYTLCNANGLMVQVINLGATIISARIPDNKNFIHDVTLGFNDLEEYMSDKNELNFGSVLGRYNSIIYNGDLKLGKKSYILSTNMDGLHHNKGGFTGFDKVIWRSYISYDRVIMTHISPHLDEGYPGDLMVQISFHLSKDNCLVINTTANTSLPTILSIGHSIYFNLAGHETGPNGLKEHSLLVNADKYVKVDNSNFPTGQLENVGSTYFDLRVPRPVWKAIGRLPGGGYNHVFCLTKGHPRESVTFACRLVHPNSGRYLEVMTDMPGLYINTGTLLPNPDAKPPLEAQVGFNEEMYPAFCREEKKKERKEKEAKEFKEAKELQAKMAAKQIWPKPETLKEASEIELPIEVEDPNLEKKVLFKDKIKKGLEVGSGSNIKEGISVDGKSSLENEGDLTSDADSKFEDEERALRFLKDTAESDIDEQEVPKWMPPQSILGRRGVAYKLNSGICFMTQEFPDCMRHPAFPKPVLKPGQRYSRTTIYKFGIIPARTDPKSALYL